MASLFFENTTLWNWLASLAWNLMRKTLPDGIHAAEETVPSIVASLRTAASRAMLSPVLSAALAAVEFSFAAFSARKPPPPTSSARITKTRDGRLDRLAVRSDHTSSCFTCAFKWPSF